MAMACQNLERFDGENILAVQIASVLSLTLVSVLVVLLIVNWLGVSESFFRLLEILLSPTVIICALVLYLWRRHDADISNIFRWITTLHSLGPHLVLAQPNKMILDPVLSRSKSGDKSEASLSDAAASPDEIQKKAEQGDAEAQFKLGTLYYIGEGVNKTTPKPPNGFVSPLIKGMQCAIQPRRFILRWRGGKTKPRRSRQMVSPRRRARERQCVVQPRRFISQRRGSRTKLRRSRQMVSSRR